MQEGFPIKLKAEDSRSGTRDTKTNGGLLELSTNHLVSLIIAVLAGFTGTHLAAWNYPFPSVMEIWMWRAAALFIFVTGAAIVSLIEARDSQ